MNSPLPFEDSSLRAWWRLTHTLTRVRNGPLTQRDVKNEGRPGYVLEKTGERDKMSCDEQHFSTKMHRLHHKSVEVALTHRAFPECHSFPSG
jgi:hypothetical protein